MALASKKKKIFDGRYEIISIVGRGSESVVYHARHAMTPSLEVALKVLLADKSKGSLSERLRREALTLVSCRHRYVVRLDDFHAVADLCYLSMEFAPEGDLRKYLAKRGRKLDPVQAQKFLEQTVEALDFIHKTGVTHRDIKPDNILVINDDEVRIADFGIALLPGEEPGQDELSSGVGSLSYMPPEVLEGRAYDQLSDQYSLALSFYEMITGIHPFEKAPLARQLDVRRDGGFPHISTLVPEMPENVASVIMKALTYDAPLRFESAEEMLRALKGEPIDEKPRTAADDKVLRPFEKRSAMQAIASSVAWDDEGDGFGSESASNTALSPAYEAPPLYEPAKTAPLDPFAGMEQYSDIVSETPAATAEETQEPEELAEPVSFEDDLADQEGTVALSPFQQKRWQEQLNKKREQEEQAEEEDDRFEEALDEAPPASQGGSFLDFVSRPDIKRRILGIVGLVAVITFVIPPILSLVFGGSSEDHAAPPIDPAAEQVASNSAPAFTLPAFTGGTLGLRNLPPGIYNGLMKGGIVPGEQSTLTLISLGPDDSGTPQVAVLIGIEGWTPAFATFPDPADQNPTYQLRVSSNGFVLDFNGDVQDGRITGTVLNKVSDETGRWGILPETEE